MGFEASDLEKLLDPKHEDDRSEILLDDLEAESRRFVAALRERLEKELLLVALEAQQQSDVFWAANKAAREDDNKGAQGRVGTRVRIINNSLVAEWYRNRFFDESPGASKKKVFSTHIKKGRGDKYSMSHFKKEPAWCREIVEIIEERYSILRKRAAAISKIRRALLEYERLIDRSHQSG